ncbi:MAG: response regulator [Bacillota bacterium]|nr:MAG: response regulator [Bacillota bacterium]
MYGRSRSRPEERRWTGPATGRDRRSHGGPGGEGEGVPSERKSVGRRVLVADDVAAVRAFLQLALTEQGYEVVLAADGGTALQLAREMRPDVILLDWVMPRMNGAQVLQALRRDPQLRQVPVILMTGSVGVDEITSEFGVRWVLEKPFGIDDLFVTLEDALAAAEPA